MNFSQVFFIIKIRRLNNLTTLDDERWRLKPVIGAVLNLLFDFQVGIIPVPNMEATIAYVIHKILDRVDGKNRRPISNYQSRSNTKKRLRVNTTLEMVRSIPGVGMGVGIEIVKVFPTIVKLTEASVSDLATVPKVGKGRAKTIFDALRGRRGKLLANNEPPYVLGDHSSLNQQTTLHRQSYQIQNYHSRQSVVHVVPGVANHYYRNQFTILTSVWKRFHSLNTTSTPY